jgi:hypothetical protein
LNNAKSKQFWLLRRYLSESGISRELAMRVQHYCDHAWIVREGKLQEKQVEVLTLLSNTLRAELRAAMYEPSLSLHPLFVLIGKLSPDTLRLLCDTGVSMSHFNKGDSLFTRGQTCSSMYLMKRGRLLYDLDEADTPPEEVDMSANNWISEAVLWTAWIHLGTMHMLEDCNVLAVSADAFAQYVQGCPEGRAEASNYARSFMVNINRDKWKASDLYHSPLVEGLWFKLINDFHYKRPETSRHSKAVQAVWMLGGKHHLLGIAETGGEGA